MANVVIPVQIKYDGSGFKQLTKDAQAAERAAMAATRQQISAQRTLQSLTRRLDRDLAAPRGGPSLAQQIGGQFVAANVLQDITAGLKDFTAASIQAGMATERLGTATENLGRRFGVSGSQIVESIQEASLGTINEMDAMRAANQAMLLGVVKSEEEFAELARLGIVLGRAMGQDAKKSIEDITIGIGRQSRLILDNLGIIVSAEKANEKYAAAVGKSVSDLTEAEKAEAFRLEVLEQGRAKVAELGDVTLDAAGQVEQLTAKWQDFQAAFGGVLIQLGQASGGTGGISGFIDKLTEGADAWTGFFKNIELVNAALQDLNKDTILGQVEQVPLFGNFVKLGDVIGSLVFRSDELGEAFTEAGEKIWPATEATEANTEATEENAEAVEEDTKAIERRQKIMRDSVREMQDIEAQALEDSTAAWDDWRDEVSDLNSDTWKTLEKLAADSAKRQKEIQRDKDKDLLKIDRDLAKAIAREQADQAKTQRRRTEDDARRETQERRKSSLDALADERLFQNELKWMAAEGDAIGIQQALERRAIEEQIASEQGAAEQQAEEENRRIEQEREEEDNRDRIAEMKAQAEEQKAERRLAASEQADEERASLEEQVNRENEAYDERIRELEEFREEKLTQIEQGKEEALQTLAEELAEAGELTNSELNQIAAAAGKLGKETGTNFAKGLAEGIQSVSEVNELLGLQAPEEQTGAAASSAFATDNIPSAGGFARGGIVPGPLGAPRRALVHGGEMITPAGQSPITVNVNGIGGADLAAFLQKRIELALNEYTGILMSGMGLRA